MVHWGTLLLVSSFRSLDLVWLSSSFYFWAAPAHCCLDSCFGRCNMNYNLADPAPLVFGLHLDFLSFSLAMFFPTVLVFPHLFSVVTLRTLLWVIPQWETSVLTTSLVLPCYFWGSSLHWTGGFLSHLRMICSLHYYYSPSPLGLAIQSVVTYLYLPSFLSILCGLPVQAHVSLLF